MFRLPLWLPAAGLVLAGCAASPSPNVAPAPRLETVNLPEAFNTPVLQNTTAPRSYGARQGTALERRNGFFVDHSIATRAYNQRIRYLVLHYTGGDDEAALKALTGRSVSAHYVVLDHPAAWRGRPVVLQLVDENRRAWHAGVSQWQDRSDLNDTSIGIEIVNQGFQSTPEGLVWEPFSEDQIALVTRLARDIVKRYHIAPTHVVGHADIAPGRKLDPGAFFPWQRLHQAGVGAWPERTTLSRWLMRFHARLPTTRQMRRALARYGYPIRPDDDDPQSLKQVVRAFQLHFRPADSRGRLDAETAAMLFALIERYQGRAQAEKLLRS